MRSVTDDPCLHALLDANAGFDLAARGTTNHCPMALVALARMGASPARLQAFFEHWRRDYALAAPVPEQRIACAAWQAHRGDRRAFHALRFCFEAWLGESAPAQVLAEVLGAIPLAPASLAFHALIRLAYGLEAAHRGEIAAGLAALVVAPLPIEVERTGREPAPGAAAGFAQIVGAMGGRAVPGTSIVARLRAVTDDPRFAEAVLAPPRNPALLDELACTTLGAYWRMPDFTVLHTVTATHAARIVSASLPPALAERLTSALWYALCAAYATVGAPSGAAAEPPEPVLDWPALYALAVASNDDHVIKMVYTCACEDRRAPSPLYRAVAARLVR